MTTNEQAANEVLDEMERAEVDGMLRYDLRNIASHDDWYFTSPVLYSRFRLEKLAELGLIERRKEEGSNWRYEARATAKGRAVLGG